MHRLNQLLAQSGSPELPLDILQQFDQYLALLQKWNARTNLTTIRDTEGILNHHFLESILCARKLPYNIVSLLDYGSGPGFPGLPIAIISNHLQITLAESQNKKASFLREVVRSLNLKVKVHSSRAEDLIANAASRFDCITLRAVDKMPQAIQSAIQLANPTGSLAILTTLKESARIQSSIQLPESHSWHPPIPILPDTDRILLQAMFHVKHS